MTSETREQDARETAYTRRQYLTYRLIIEDVPIWEAIEAVATTALAHPDWDMEERMTWSEWLAAEER